ncbi:hypothetical protein [Hymenobacter sp. BT491]|uniref:hypothetical protein n=1 Tax=Hymenobacter sp. BT491 TaxID=2766779 RepID=UPI001653E7DC|nr:hypothetical protein [Hymenobacter sp. BT491]MBC6989878.1 hypothetical protein [Hymenobacter sp. BT491]
MIYATNNHHTFKITSPRRRASYHKCLVVGGCYRFQLTSWFAPQPSEPTDLSQAGGVVVNGVAVDREPATGDDLFFDDRLENLCFTKR